MTRAPAHDVPVTLRYLDGSTATLRVTPTIVTELLDAVRVGDIAEFDTDDLQHHVVRGDALCAVQTPAEGAWWELSIAVDSRRAWTEDTALGVELEGYTPQASCNTELRDKYPTVLYFLGLASRAPAELLRAADTLTDCGVEHAHSAVGPDLPKPLEPRGGYLAILHTSTDEAMLRVHRVDEPAQTQFDVDGDEGQQFLTYVETAAGDDTPLEDKVAAVLREHGWDLASEWEPNGGDEWAKVVKRAA